MPDNNDLKASRYSRKTSILREKSPYKDSFSRENEPKTRGKITFSPNIAFVLAKKATKLPNTMPVLTKKIPKTHETEAFLAKTNPVLAKNRQNYLKQGLL